MKLRPLTLAIVLMAALSPPAHATDDGEAKRLARWQDLKEDLFGNRPIAAGPDLIHIDAPLRALDAALVPVTLKISRKDGVKAVHLVIDENPAPYAAKITFGPAGDPRETKLRVRVNDYTYVHAVLEMNDGQLYQASAFVKAAGGCSAPAGASDEEALQGAGQMRMRMNQQAGTADATLMIRHPNFTGMQMNQITRLYTPARYLKEIKVTLGGATVFDLTGDISLSSDPVIGFAYDATRTGDFQVEAIDTQGSRWAQAFPAAPSAP